MAIAFRFRPPHADAERAPVDVHFDEDRVRIGRASGCELRLPHPSVSELHAMARQGADGSWSLVDEGSRNGTWVNGCRLAAGAARVLRDGDLVRVGSIWTEVRVSSGSPARLSTREMALEIVARLLDVSVPTVLVVEGPDSGERLALSEQGRAYSIGRSSRCDMHLMDLGVSREHVRVRREGARIVVQDAGGKGGILLGDAALPSGSTAPWPPSLAARIGSTVLALQLPPALDAVADQLVVEQAGAPPGEPPANMPPDPPPPAPAADPATAAPEAAPSAAAAAPTDAAAIAIVPEPPSPTMAPPRKSAGNVAMRAAVVLLLVLVVVSIGACIWILFA